MFSLAPKGVGERNATVLGYTGSEACMHSKLNRITKCNNQNRNVL